MTVSRRRFLAGLGAAAVSAPLLGLGRRALAGPQPMNLVIFYSGNSLIHPSVWRPGAGFALPQMLSPLAGLEDRILFIDNVRNPFGRGHDSAGSLFTGHDIVIPNAAQHWVYSNPGTSLDYHVAHALGGPVRLPVLHTGALVNFAAGNSHKFVHYDGGVRQPFIAHPMRAFEAAFGTSYMAAEEPVDLRRQRRVLGANQEELRAMLGQRTPEVDARLGSHLDAIDSQLSLLAPSTVTCSPTPPSLPAGYPTADADVQRNRGLVNQWGNDSIRGHIDVMVQALRCGVTRVATMTIGDSGVDFGQPSVLDPSITSTLDCHDLTHNTGGASAPTYPDRVRFEQWRTRHLRYLLDQLGPDLDHTLVLYARPIGHNHDTNNIPFMLIGGDGTHFTPRRHLDAGGASAMSLWRAVGQIMNVDMTGFGDGSDTSAALPV